MNTGPHHRHGPETRPRPLGRPRWGRRWRAAGAGRRRWRFCCWRIGFVSFVRCKVYRLYILPITIIPQNHVIDSPTHSQAGEAATALLRWGRAAVATGGVGTGSTRRRSSGRALGRLRVRMRVYMRNYLCCYVSNKPCTSTTHTRAASGGLWDRGRRHHHAGTFGLLLDSVLEMAWLMHPSALGWDA